MSSAFRDSIRKALDNPGLQAALDANAERRIQARLSAFSSLPESLSELRGKAHAVRAETITHLDRYLDLFIAKAEANGFIIHQAADANQAVQTVLDISRRHGARLVAKSKTMVGEEIEVNQALEDAGLQVVETDLGEYIVQLRRERPAHIITPAVHLNRRDVGQTFFEKLGLPLTEDVEVMTAAARRILRQTFLAADVGISGVNFGVAESGSLCLVTNEGNGRMVTTLPRVHIALMGIERLVPTLDNLALMLALLPRSATGQKISVYTSLIHGPRRAGDPDGPLERHLILVDNGRSRLRSSPLVEILYCIRCGACLNACPVFREIGGHAYTGKQGQSTPYPGPIGSIVSPGLFGQAEFGHLARASSLCGACKEACPVDIDLPKLLLRVRAGGVDLANQDSHRVPDHVPHGLKWGLRLYVWAAASARRFTAAQRMAGLLARGFARFSRPGRDGPLWLRLPAFTGWGYSRDFPAPAAQSFRQRWAARDAKPAAQAADPAPEPWFSARTPGQLPTVESGPFQPPRDGAGQTGELASRFGEELTALGGRFSLCTSEDAPEQILALLRELDVSAVYAWEEPHLPSGLLDRLRQAGIEIHHTFDGEPEGAEGRQVRAGLTGALAGIAETGTLVLPSGPGRPAAASLLPEIHLAVLRASQIRLRMAQILALPEVRRAASVALISGPSRTADIEMTLSIGVHGPREVHVFCTPD